MPSDFKKVLDLNLTTHSSSRFLTLRFLVLISLGLFLACATLKDPYGLGIRQREPSLAIPESLRVEMEIIPHEPRMPPLSARLYIRTWPESRAYRMDLYSFPLFLVASWLWEPQGSLLLLHDRREFLRGKGDSLNLGWDVSPKPDIHALLGFLWGRPLPYWRDAEANSTLWKGDTVYWEAHGKSWQAQFDPHTGACHFVASPGLRLEYGKLMRVGNRVLAQSVEVIVEGKPMLSMRIKKIEDKPSWKKSPFSLNVPKDYKE